MFAALGLPRLLLHEMWRDEAWQWLAIAESTSVPELFDALARGSGQGYLFPLACFLIRLVWPSPLSMQLANLAVVSAAAYAFVRWAPFARRDRLLFTLGYFPFFEYALFSRSYGTGLLLLLLACVAWRCRWPALALGAVLGLLCQTTVYGFIQAVALGGGWLAERWQRRRELAPLPLGERVAGAALALAGAVAGLVQLSPAAGTQIFPWRLGWEPAYALRVIGSPWRGLVPVPSFGPNFWDTNLLDTWRPAEGVAGAAVIALALAVLWRSPVAAAVFAAGTAGLLAFGYAYFHGVVRHHGALWLVFVAAVWVGGGAALLERRWRAVAWRSLLVLHCAVATYASWMDLRRPFSNGGSAAELVRSAGLDRLPLLGHREPPATTVALHLGRPLWSPSREIYTTRPDWGPRQRELTDAELRCAARKLARLELRDVGLVINRPLPPWEETQLIGFRVGAIVRTEDYHVYRLMLGRLPPTAAAAACAEELAAAVQPGS